MFVDLVYRMSCTVHTTHYRSGRPTCSICESPISAARNLQFRLLLVGCGCLWQNQNRETCWGEMQEVFPSADPRQRPFCLVLFKTVPCAYKIIKHLRDFKKFITFPSVSLLRFRPQYNITQQGHFKRLNVSIYILSLLIESHTDCVNEQLQDQSQIYLENRLYNIWSAHMKIQHFDAYPLITDL